MKRIRWYIFSVYLASDQVTKSIREDEVRLLSDDQDEFVVFDANQ